MQCVLVCWGDLFACSGGLLIKMYSMYKMGIFFNLCLWVTGYVWVGGLFWTWKAPYRIKLIPRAGTVDKWVPADEWGNMHSGYDHTAAKYGCHSKAEVHTQFSHRRGQPPNTEEAKWVLEIFSWIWVCMHLDSTVHSYSLPYLYPPPPSSLRYESPFFHARCQLLIAVEMRFNILTFSVQTLPLH